MRIGTDIIEISRIKQATEKNVRFPKSVLTAKELAIYEKFPEKRRYEFLAGRFSAKEAYGKALKTGVGTRIKFIDIEILPDDTGVPHITKGPVIEGVQISISHAREYATAVVLVELDEEAIEVHLMQFQQNKEE